MVPPQDLEVSLGAGGNVNNNNGEGIESEQLKLMMLNLMERRKESLKQLQAAKDQQHGQ
jgi:hypothetical protein